MAVLLLGACGLMPGMARAVVMPDKGISAHRGASVSHPENTLAAFREAIWLGAQQIELDVNMTSDGHLVIMHDATVNRTTDGSGYVTGFTLAELKQLDAGSRKHARFTGERVPTLGEVLDILPENVWLNVHMRGGNNISYAAAMEVFEHQREHQAFLSVTASQVQGARDAAAAAGKALLLCNMEGQSLSASYATATINGGFDFLQFLSGSGAPPAAADVQRLHDAGVKINYYSGAVSDILAEDKRTTLRNLFAADVDFPLVDDAAMGLSVAEEFFHEPVRPQFRGGKSTGSLGTNLIVNPGAEIWMDDYRQPTTGAPPQAEPLLTRDREFYGWNDMVEVTNIPYDAPDMPSSTRFPASAFGEAAFFGGHLVGTRWIEQTIDIADLAAAVDTGMIEYSLSAWLGGMADRRDYTSLSASFRDGGGDELALARISTLMPDDWGNITGMSYHETEGLVPASARSIQVRLWFNGQSGNVARGMADNLSLVLADVTPAASIPEPSAIILLCCGALGLFVMSGGRRFLKTP